MVGEGHERSGSVSPLTGAAFGWAVGLAAAQGAEPSLTSGGDTDSSNKNCLEAAKTTDCKFFFRVPAQNRVEERPESPNFVSRMSSVPLACR